MPGYQSGFIVRLGLSGTTRPRTAFHTLRNRFRPMRQIILIRLRGEPGRHHVKNGSDHARRPQLQALRTRSCVSSLSPDVNQCSAEPRSIISVTKSILNNLDYNDIRYVFDKTDGYIIRPRRILRHCYSFNSYNREIPSIVFFSISTFCQSMDRARDALKLAGVVAKGIKIGSICSIPAASNTKALGHRAYVS